MIHYDDLVAARILNRQLPQHRDLLLASLDALRQGERQAGLLADMVNREVLTTDQACYVFEEIKREKRSNMVSVYAHLLGSRGIDMGRLRNCMAQVGANADLNTFADAVVTAGLIPAPNEQRVRYRARQLTDRDRAKQVKAYRASRTDAPSHANAEPNMSISGVIMLPAEPVQFRHGDSGIQLPINSDVVNRISSAQLPQPNLTPPQFSVPEFVDTSVAIAGARIGQYRIVGRIGAGAMGVVYLADSPNDPTRPVAIKVLNDEADNDAHGRFKREILANSFFSHPGVIDVYDAGQTSAGNDFLAMEFFDGQDLEEILDNDTKLAPGHALRLCRQVFEVLGAAHDAGIVHKDVKPANILVSRDGETSKLMDFGVAVIKDLGEFEHMVFQTIEGGATGTPQFMSPEQAAGDTITTSSDLYSMGIVLYLALSGRLPYESETASGFMACHMLEDPIPLAKAGSGMKGLPKPLHALLGALFEKNPQDRPADAAAVIQIIDEVLPKIKAKKGGLFGLFWRGR